MASSVRRYTTHESLILHNYDNCINLICTGTSRIYDIKYCLLAVLANLDSKNDLYSENINFSKYPWRVGKHLMPDGKKKIGSKQKYINTPGILPPALVHLIMPRSAQYHIEFCTLTGNIQDVRIHRIVYKTPW